MILLKTCAFFVAALSLFLFPQSVLKADSSFERLKGQWTTYNVRMEGSFIRWDADISDQRFIQETEINVFMPLFQKEGFSLKVVIDQLSATKYEKYEDALRLTGKVESIWFKFKSVKSAVESNQKSYCGYSDWQVGVYKDVTGRVCKDSEENDDENEPTPSRGDLIEHVFVFQDGKVFTNIEVEQSMPNDDDTSPSDNGPDDFDVNFNYPIFLRGI